LSATNLKLVNSQVNGCGQDNSGAAGIYVGGGCQFAQILGCSIQENASYGINIDGGSYTTVARCSLINNCNNCIWDFDHNVYHCGGPISNGAGIVVTSWREVARNC
jgi:hypothetical protein